MSESRIVELSYRLDAVPDDWVLPEDPVPESRPHDLTIDRLKALLNWWVQRTGRDAIVARNLAVRWLRDRPRIGIDPDVALIEPAPPDADELLSLKLWDPGNTPPRLAIEVVSPRHPYKDYAEVQDRYAAFGVGELWVLDRKLRGPRKLGGPFAIQIWRFIEHKFRRVYHGPGPAHSIALDAWVSFADGEAQISDDADGRVRWLTELEAANLSNEAERVKNEAERAALEARIRELEGRLGKD